MIEEYRDERCPDCGDARERIWLVQTMARGLPVRRPWRTESAHGSWKTVAAPTRWHTLCLCDAP